MFDSLRERQRHLFIDASSDAIVKKALDAAGRG
jgi:hypothetical protein